MWHVMFVALLVFVVPWQPRAAARSRPAYADDVQDAGPADAAGSARATLSKTDVPGKSKRASKSQSAGAPKGSVDEPAAQPADTKVPTGSTGTGGPRWSAVAEEILSSGAIGELRRGGLFMWPILVLGIVAAGVVLERWRSLKMVGSDTAALRRDVLNLLESDRVEDALDACDQRQGPVPYVLAVGLRKYLVLRRLGYDPGQVSDQVVRAMDDHSVHIVAALERHLPILATVSSVAPMLGFLGTVQGMVVAFREIVARMGETNIVEAAAMGINIALLTTVFGLIVGIPTYIAYNYFTSVINGYVLQVEESATELIETVTLKMALETGDLGN